MEDRIPQQAKELNHKRARRRTWHKVLAAAACVVVFCTTYALILPAITMEKTAYCGYEAHTHSEACYTRTLICGQEEDAQPHQHTDACYQTEDVLICPLPEGGHVHDEGCYDEQGELICQQEEGHIHTAECYQARPALVCGMEETSAAHVHTDVCYEELLTCELPEHQHTLPCYSDHEADIETADIWERGVSAMERSDTWAEDVIAIAQSQLGCRESDKNYIVTETGVQKGITRYGQWYGDAYGDWCAMFVSFCLHYGGVPEEAVSHESSCPRWQTALTERKLFRDAAQQTPQAGDIVFFDLDADGEADHVGLVEALEDAARLVGEEEEAYQILHTIEGNNGDSVQRHTYDLPDDETVLGYVPLELAEHSLYQCGMLSHRHGGDCTGADGMVTCQKKEHVHDDSCLTPRTGDLTYEDDQIIMHLHVEGENVLPEDTRMEVTAVDTGDKDYQPFADYTDSKSVADDSQEEDAAAYAADTQSAADTAQMIVRGVTLLSGGQVLDTAGYTLTAEVEVKPTVIEPMLAELAAVEDAAPEAELGVVFTVLRQTDEQQVEAVDSVLMQTEDAVPTLTVPVSNGVVALEVGTPNPHYTVQYYAYIPRFAKSGDKELTVIDTSDGKGLPTNSSTLATKQLYLERTGETTGKNAGDATDIYRVATENTLTKMYSSGSYEYVKAPNPSYVNKLIDNPNYTLKEVWVLKGTDETSTNKDDWDVYGADIHFTNRKEGTAGKDNVIYIADGAVIRLVYDATPADFTTPANFYDYDITDDSGNTGGKGINQKANYGTSINGSRTWDGYQDILAFGNANCGTGMANYKFDGVYLNKHSGQNYGCTFGLADSLKDGKIVYNEWVVAPKLFNDGTANGKHIYDENSSLTFSRVGDTYTLSAATVNGVGSIGGLQDFFNPSPSQDIVYDGRAYTYTDTNGQQKTANRPVIFTNNFWPMDQATSAQDPKFGKYGEKTSFSGKASVDDTNVSAAPRITGNFPVSDDGNAHNSFFGMQYAVKFKLSRDYVGPLEYYFFGDDDMWVFLDDKLVCDIGGVHSSVGEYVDLWDYIDRETLQWDEKGEREFTLTFFYTERGASGSTCYMNFTLPSVSGINLEQKTGELRIQKQVVGDTDATKEFNFEIRLSDANGNAISDDYSYSKYGSNNEEIETDLVAHDGSKFTLRNGEYIIIKYLPFGLRYTVTETTPDGYTVSSTVNGILQTGTDSNTAKGTIIRNVSNTVLFTNTVGKVGLKLQKLDTDGTTLSGAIFQLKNSAGQVVEFVKKADGSYAATTQTSDTIDTSKLYYIALASDTDYVVGQAQPEAEPYKAQLQKKTGADSQKVKVYKQVDGSYSFQLQSDNRWLDLHEGELDSHQMIHFWKDSDTAPANDCQKWFLTPNENGFYIQPRKAVINKIDSVMDLSGGTVAEGTDIQLYEKNKTAAQRWLLVPVETDVSPGEITTDLTVDGSGVLQLTELFPGDYALVESKSPAGYQILDKAISLNVDKNGNVELAEDQSDLVKVTGSGKNLVLKVFNRHTDKVLTLTKKVVDSNTSREFTFTVRYQLDGETKEEQLSLADGVSETVTIPHGAKVTITENNHDGFSVSFAVSSTDSKTTLVPNEDGSVTFTMTDNVTITATNTAGYALPETGGSGAALYLVLGLLLMGGSALALGLRRRREAG